ncbi:hypothetical protein HK101_000685 [Irineochytrium annulatum]|nr:hypothetical protein HK101_000685 [Irineochytrium annulatum]
MKSCFNSKIVKACGLSLLNGKREQPALGHTKEFQQIKPSKALAWSEAVRDYGYQPTPVRDRQYFNAIYFREAGGILFEIATDPPGFAKDEPADSLGQKLMLPEWFEKYRAQIEDNLQPIVEQRRMMEKKVTWLELFYDLLFVAAVSKADILIHRIFLILQLLSVMVMTASLSTHFDQYYLSFFVGYIGSRAFTAIQYLTVHKSKRIAVDIVLPLIGRKNLVKVPVQTHHLLERFALFTLILLGESVVSIIAVLQADHWDMKSILFAAFTSIFVIAMWWQYFDNVEKKVSKEIQTAGQAIIYGHLFIYISMSMIAASIQLLYQNQLNYVFMLGHAHLRLGPRHLAFMVGLLAAFVLVDLVYRVPGYVIMGEDMLFFLVYAKLTT